jgi:polyhydroxyalkanoate synthase
VANQGNNQLARGEMEVGGQHLSLQDVKSDAYVVGAVNDHIVPWQASYKACGTSCPTEGTSPASSTRQDPKARHEVAGKNRPTAAEWRASAESRSGSWWEGTGPDGPGSGPVP